MQIQFLSQEDPLERKWQPTPVFLPGESPWTEEPGGLQSMGQQSWTQLHTGQQLQPFARRKDASRPGSKSRISPWGGEILRERDTQFSSPCLLTFLCFWAV